MPSGNALLRSLKKSAQEPVVAAVKGEIPKWVSGTLFRNGPGRYEYGSKEYRHLFDGQSCLHKFKINSGKVYYSNKFPQTKSYKEASEGVRLDLQFGTPDLCENIFGRIKHFFKQDVTDNTNVNIMPYSNQQLYALTETNKINRIDPSNLEVSKKLNVRKYAKSLFTTIAHPHVDNEGGWITMGMNHHGSKSAYELVRFKSVSNVNEATNMCEQVEMIGRIPSSHSSGLSYFHSFGVTENYVIFLEQSLQFDIKSIIKNMILNKAYSDALKVNKDFATRIHVVNKITGEATKQRFVTDPLILFHHINAYENEQNILIDICAYDVNHFDLTKSTRDVVFTSQLDGAQCTKSIGRRIRVPMNSKQSDKNIHCEIKDINSDVSFELPVINYSKYNAKPYKYTYGVNFYKSPYSVVKINVDNGEAIANAYNQDGIKYLPTEPIFVANPNSTSEDDGVLLVMVLSDKQDFLSVLDARNLKEIARAELPPEVKGSMTFHGFFADTNTFPKLNV